MTQDSADPIASLFESQVITLLSTHLYSQELSNYVKDAASKIDSSGKDLAKAQREAKEARDSRDAMKREKETAES